MNSTDSNNALATTFVLACVAARELRQQAPSYHHVQEGAMLGTILIIVLILLLIGAFPAWPHSRGWGYWPSGTLGLVVLIVVILVLLGRI